MQQTGSEGIQERARIDEKGDRLEIMKVIKLWPYRQMLNTQTRISSEKWDEILRDFEITKILPRKLDRIA